jgi:hypothetical protein
MKLNKAEFINIQDGFMVLIGVAALIAGSCLFVAYSGGKTGYIDPGVNVKQGCLALVTAERKKDSAQLGDLGDTLTRIRRLNVLVRRHGRLRLIDTLPVCSASDTLRRRLFLLNAEAQRIAYTWDSAYQIPTSFRPSLLFDRDSFVNFIRNYPSLGRLNFLYVINDTSTGRIRLAALNIPGQLMTDAPHPEENHMDMFRKYPSTAFWVLLSIAQGTFWALIMVLCFAVFKQLRDEIKNRNMQTDPPSLHTSWIVTLIALSCFIVILYALIYDKKINFDNFFLAGFSWTMFIYAIVGYFTAFLFLSGYLRMAYYVRLALDSYSVSVKELKAKKVVMRAHTETLRTMAPDLNDNQKKKSQDLIDSLSQGVDDNTKEVETLKDNYQLCNRYFRFFFGASAIVLSVLVIWMGSLFQAGNELDLFHLYAQETGHPFLPNDFVYLYGGLHSLLLFIFYIPVKMRLMSMSFAIPGDGGTTAETEPDWQGYLKKFFSRFVEILTASSPLLAASLEKLFS